MPTSHLHQLSLIVEAIDILNPRTMLDVGVGFGKYGVLAREFLELRDGRSRYDDWQRRIDGVEVFEGYLTPLHRFAYDDVHVGNAIDVLPTLPTVYDLVLLVDVLEHFTRSDGAIVLRHCLQRGHNVVVSTPRIFLEQDAVFGNPHERHLSRWTKQDLASYGPLCVIPNDISLICVLGRDQQAVRRTMRSPRRRLKELFPFLRYPYRALTRLGARGRQRM
jgi:hypothetical protein